MPVWASILAVAITAGASIITVLITNRKSQIKAEFNHEKLAEEIYELKIRVSEHNNFALRLVALETELRIMKEAK